MRADRILVLMLMALVSMFDVIGATAERLLAII